MAIELSTAEVASLKGCSTQYIRRLAKTEELKGHKCLNADGSPGWMFLVEELPTKLQEKYYNQLRASLPEASLPEGAKPKVAKPLDTYSAEEQEEIAFWLRLVKQWQGYRNKPGANKTEVDANFVQWCKLEYPERAISVDTLYRRWNAVRDNDLDGLIDKRGKWKKGKSSIPDPMWQAFLYFYLDERQHPLKKCYEYTKLEMQMSFPELVGDMPSYTTFYRRAQADIPEPLKVLGREGEKAFRDRCAPYIRRVYDDMRSNEWWIADNHTFDIITEGENGQRHRLYLTAFFDARSGIFTGCYVTNAPSSQSTLIALRRGILKYGIPENIYVDNGREFLTYDVGGLGHRKKKPKDGQERFEPPPVFERLGIHMTNAIVRNAKAKIIERRFRDVKDHLSRLFDTFTGGNVLEKPESLKFILKDGRIPLDSTLVETVEELLDWYFNQQPYGGAVAKDHGKPRQQVYNENLHTKRVASAEDLNLMLMRSSRAQKVTRRGVHLDIAGQRIDYWNDELVFNYLGQQVYYRYDPDDLSEVRVYDLQDRFIMSVPADNTAVLTYYDLMVMRVSEGEASFNSEEQNEPINPDDCLFMEEWFDYYNEAEVNFGDPAFDFFGFIDPSLGKTKRSDFSAIVTLAKHKGSGYMYVVDADIERRHPDRIIADVLAKERWLRASFGHGYRKLGAETNQFQWFLKEELAKASAKAGLYLPIEEVQQTSDKVMRIQTLQPDVKNKYIKFNRRHKRLLEQLTQFPMGAHDDGPDALEGARSIAKRVKRFRIVNRAEFGI